MSNRRRELSTVITGRDQLDEHELPALEVVDEIQAEDTVDSVLRETSLSTAPGSVSAATHPYLMLPRCRIDAFVDSPSLFAVIDCAAKDRRAVRSEFTVNRGSFVEAMERYREHAPADLVVIEDSARDEALEFRIAALAEFCPPSTRLVVIGERNDIVLYRRLIKIGVSEYLVPPVTPLALLDSIAMIFMDEADTRDRGLVVAFLGARGGVGSSTVAHNAAAILSRHYDATTLLIDADIGFGTAALQFDISSPQGLADAWKEREDLNGELLERLTHWRDKRFGILTAPDRPDQMAAPEPGVMHHVIDQARRLARYVVLDLPHGWAPHTAEAIAAADIVVLVATPDLPSLRNTRTFLALIQTLRPNDEPAHLILNRMPVRGKPPVSIEDFTRTLDRKITVALPFNEAAASAEMAGRVLAENAPSADVVSAIGSLITEMVGTAPIAKRKVAPQSLLARIFSPNQK